MYLGPSAMFSPSCPAWLSGSIVSVILSASSVLFLPVPEELRACWQTRARVDPHCCLTAVGHFSSGSLRSLQCLLLCAALPAPPPHRWLCCVARKMAPLSWCLCPLYTPDHMLPCPDSYLQVRLRFLAWHSITSYFSRFLMRYERGEWKSWLKTQHSKN